MRTKLMVVGLIVSVLLAACSPTTQHTPHPTAQPTPAPPTPTTTTRSHLLLQTQDPIVFLHGVSLDNSTESCNSAPFWGTAKAFLEAPHSAQPYGNFAWSGQYLITLGYYSADTQCDQTVLEPDERQQCSAPAHVDNNTPILTLACLTAWYIYDHYAKAHYEQTGACGGQAVQVVAHSMGGLIIQAALSLAAVRGAATFALPPCPLPVVNVITFSTPYQGTQFPNDGSVDNLSFALNSSGLLEMCILSLFCSSKEISDMDGGSSFIQALEAHGQDPQGVFGTTWTQFGADCTPDILGPTTVGMDLGTKIVFHQPCYAHSSNSSSITIKGNAIGYLADDSASLDAQVWRCDGCGANPTVQQWGHLLGGQPHALYAMFFALLGLEPAATPAATADAACPIFDLGVAATMPALTGSATPPAVPHGAQLSPDKQWLLSVSAPFGTTAPNLQVVVRYIESNGVMRAALDYHLPRAAIQVVRIDGRYQQTLECTADITSAHWEPDQKAILISILDCTPSSTSKCAPPLIFRLELDNGVMTEESSQATPTPTASPTAAT